jgi:amidohydrolase
MTDPTAEPARVKEDIRTEVERLRSLLVDVSHDIHAHPEMCFAEHHAHARLTAELEKAGFDVTRHARGVETAFEASFGDPSGPTVAVLCEYDALPGLGHACGHNIIAAAGLGAFLAVAPFVEQAGGAVRVIGTPAEEGGGGKIELARRGAFDGLAAALMVHPADHDLLFMDTLAIRRLVAAYEGTAAHAASAPHQGRNALDAAVIGYVSVAALRQHIMPTERVHGIFLEAGEQANIVPRRAVMEWYVRSNDLDTLEPLCERVEASLAAGASATGCGCTIERLPNGYADLRSNAELERVWSANARLIGRDSDDPRQVGRHVVGSTDMGNISHLVPSIHPMIAAAPAGTPIHTEAFAVAASSELGDAAAVDGAFLLAATTFDILQDPDVRGRSDASFGTPSDRRRVL